MTSTNFRTATILVASLVFAACDGSSTTDAGTDTGPSDVHSIVDSGMNPDTGSHDSGNPMDTGTDSGTPMDSGTDSGSPIDSGVDVLPIIDSGDVASPSDVLSVDGASDSGDAGASVDGSTDAGGTADTGADAGTLTYSFASPLQVDLSSIFTVDTVANTSATGQSFPPLTAMDGSGNTYFTASAGATVSDASGGLPDDGHFASNADHPSIQLAFNNTSVSPNSLILNDPATSVLTTTFPIVATHYAALQLYFTSTEGSSNVQVTLSYSDSTTSVTTFAAPDWFNPFAAASPVFVVQQNVGRFSMTKFDTGNGASLFGAAVVVDPSRTLTSVTVAETSGAGRLVIYGATAY